MINYDYICKNCGHELKDVLQSIKDDPLTLCEKCGEHSLSRVIFGGRAAFVENISTIGQLADKNTRHMGSYQKSELEAKAKESKPNASETIYSKHAKATKGEINKMSEQQKQNYILKGKK
tara:strand:- start:11869 stop:12228 length:360 start_codon:yes stop_codon:yes gene_type:complete